MRNRGAAGLVVLAAAIVFVVVNSFNALHKGGDAEVFFDGGRRLLHALPLYENSGPAAGFIGPPFQAVFFAPLAAVHQVSDPVARLLWYAISLTCLGAGVMLWSSAWTSALAQSGLAPLHRARSLWLALLAIVLPLQTNFEHQNMSTLLLASTGGAAWSLVNDRRGLAGALIGFAAALKAFPVFLVVYLGARQLWRSLTAAIVTVVVLTILPVFVYGAGGFRDVLLAWTRIGSGGWPVRGANQSLIAAVDRVLAGASKTGVRSPADSPATVFVFGVIATAAVLGGIWFVRTRKPRGALLPCELAAAVTLAVLLSPVAWDHYWVLLFPAFLFVCDSSSPRLLGRGGAIAFVAAAILTSGISRATVGRGGWSVARDYSVSTSAAVILYCALLALWRRLSSLAYSAGHGAP